MFGVRRTGPLEVEAVRACVWSAAKGVESTLLDDFDLVV